MNKETVLYATVAQAAYLSQCNDKNFRLTAKFENKATDTQGIVGEAFGDNFVVAFRGSEETGLADWITDLKFIPAVYPYGKSGDTSMQVHSGFLGAYQSVREAVINIVKKNPLPKVVTVGHSLGGALAILSALDIAFNVPGKVVSCYTFGAPKVGNASFAKTYQEKVTQTFRFVNGSDVVPSCPPGNFAHVGELCCIGNASSQEWSWSDVVNVVMDKVEDHLPQNYIKVLRDLIK
jgi:hypothetical protein